MVRFMCNGKLFLEDVFQKMCRKFIFIDVFLSSLHHVPSRTLLLLCLLLISLSRMSQENILQALPHPFY